MYSHQSSFKKQISSSYNKIQKVCSEKKIRIKSFRVHTTNQNEIQDYINNKLGISPPKEKNKSAKQIIVPKNYVKQLNNLGYSSQFLKNLYQLRSEENDLKSSELKYISFLKLLHSKLITKDLNLIDLNLPKKSAIFFLQQYLNCNRKIISLSLNNIDLFTQNKLFNDSQMINPLSKENNFFSLLIKILQKEINLMKISLCNTNMTNENVENILKIINQQNRIYSLDLSNQNSQMMNRFQQSDNFLYEFINTNTSVAILKLNNLNLKKLGFEKIYKGINSNPTKLLRILSLANNNINKCPEIFSQLLKSGITHFNLSENPLGIRFFQEMPLVRNCTVRSLNLSATEMDSEALILLLTQLQDSKSLKQLKVNNNNFSHHWIQKIRQKLSCNSSLEIFSCINCSIKHFVPFFNGLTHNKSLLKLNLSNNTIDPQLENLEQIGQFLLLNRTLKELKMRFCGLKYSFFKYFLNALQKNKAIIMMDISQNSLGQEGAKIMLKMLIRNNTITNIVLDKVQISLRIKAQLQSRLRDNKNVKEKKQFKELQRVNNSIKAKDQYSWQHLESLEIQSKLIKRQTSELERINFQKQDTLKLKKIQIIEINAKREEQLKQLTAENKEIKRIQIQNLKQMEKKAKKINERYLQLVQSKEIQEKLILNLQKKIEKQSEIVLKKELHLEEKLRNEQYIIKKKQNKNKKKIFDNLTSLPKQQNPVLK